MKRQFLIFLTTLCLFGVVSVSYAAATVVDMSQPIAEDQQSESLEIDQGDSSVKNISRRNEPIDQRVARLERQMSNFTDSNLVGKLEKTQQELAQLRGQLEVQNHEMAQLKEQLRHFYQDLDQRVSKSNEPVPVHKKENITNDSNSATSASNEENAADNDSQKELQNYEQAFNLLNKKDYDKAITAFQAFTKTYPDSSYAVNAHYWLGEIFYLKAKPSLANKEFQLILSKYPSSQKTPDAMLKLALLSMDAGNYQKAKQHLQKLQKQFPSTTAAKAAAVHLKEIKSHT